MSRMPDLGSIDFLNELKGALQDLAPELLFDYTTVGCRCFEMDGELGSKMGRVVLSSISNTTQMNQEWASGGFIRAIEDLSKYAVVYEALRRRHAPAKDFEKAEELYKSSLKSAAELIRTHIKNKGDVALSYARKQLPGFTLDAVDFFGTSGS